uniref:ORNITHINE DECARBOXYLASE n=1 Tax=Trypanosoma brucei TaxID=5691 RepID=UPI00001114F8|nr:Chain A, Ornithine Decarboxylase [Trypanosoma brucei]1F3T_B Chain B, Ornithine Decarboxylase [Trypanosoma brucei]1F3T_C Chain C, Ornithine Decarboxylase [Trypanosoma brucei]1F3T_D Chain D, Ornithine Decarboxylase [Trypanosoma brucei]1QU4_A Chain A, ORNITHINE DECARBOXYLASE [Trypanosoma brucei]1QU4_B Chain B, ORNITHINE DECARBOXYLASE [Trypanosoma brucei]1QU4_C Chain C, ORNITHINE DECARBOXYLASE [Trypanosoma brucei]1QU4_D Chain D, ORNITHINE DECARBOXYLASE [Trypanosoma brucei]
GAMDIVVNDDLSCRFLEGFNTRDALCKKISMNTCDEGDPFFVADLGDIVRKHETWKKCLPRVTPFYAVKCNDDWRVLGTLAALGTGFDCASNTEIQRVRGIGVPPEKIIYANPCKQISHIRYARDSGVDVMTFDCVDELEKVAKTHPKAKMVLRISTDDSLARCRLSVKFGAKVEDCRFILEQAKKLNIDVTGVSFHVGSGSTDASTFAQAISDSRFVFDMGTELGFNMHILDIGGGFPGTRDAPLKFEEIAGVINNALEKHFPPDLKLTIVAEPGRYYVASAFTLAVNVIAKKVTPGVQTDVGAHAESNAQSFMYYVNDGVYGSFNCILYDHAVVRPLPQREPIPNEKLYPSSVWGPTCDGLDQIVERYYLPEMQVGEWLLFEDMGAYTVVGTSSFNGFQSPTIYYVVSGLPDHVVRELKSQKS